MLLFYGEGVHRADSGRGRIPKDPNPTFMHETLALPMP